MFPTHSRPVVILLLACVVSLAAVERAESPATFALGATVVDQARERLFVVDRSNLRLLQIDLATGEQAVAALLASRFSSVPAAGALDTAALAISPDGAVVYLSLPTESRILWFGAAALNYISSVTLGVSSPLSGLAYAGAGKIAVPVYAAGYSRIGIISLATGAMLGSSGSFLGYPRIQAGAGGSIYGVDVHLSSASLQLKRHAVSSGGVMTESGSWGVPAGVLNDYSVDETRGLLYLMNLGAMDAISTGDGSTVNSTLVSNAIAVGQADPVGTMLCGFGNTLICYDKTGFAERFRFQVTSGGVREESIRATGRGTFVYATDTDRIGVVGQRKIRIDLDSPAADITYSKTSGSLAYRFDSSGSAPRTGALTGYDWTLDGVVVGHGSTYTLQAEEGRTYEVGLMVHALSGASAYSQLSLLASTAAGTAGGGTDGQASSGAGSGACGAGSLSIICVSLLLAVVMTLSDRVRPHR